jgi:calcineurin-like phosphoesterase family protein
MRDIWFTSDQHFGHANILKFTDKAGNLIRPEFSTVDEMDECMLDRWNSVVKKGDIVWNLGDICFDKKKFTDKILNRLNGALRITVGNHDDIKFLASLGRFQKIVVTRRFDEFGFVASHYPLHQDSLWNHRKQKTVLCLHGHTHQNDPAPGPYHNVSVERTNYTPVHIDEITAIARQKCQ